MDEEVETMTMYVYSGTPGSGKSLHAASEIRFNLNRKSNPRPVIANFNLAPTAKIAHPECFTYVPNNELTPQYLMEYAIDYWSKHEFHEDWIRLYLDEVAIIYNSRTWNDKDNHRQEWLTFFSQHRKYGFKVILIAQNAKMIDTQFRMNIDYEIIHRKVSTMGWMGFLMALPFMGRLFVHVETMFQMGERISASYHVPRKADMEMYDTRATFDPSTGVVARATATAIGSKAHA